MQQIGRYEVERELGRGAMGVVYLARDTRIGRSVALKTIRLSDFADDEKLQRLRERLVREAQSAGILSHENIVTIYDVDEWNGLSYICMEYVEGESLERVLIRRRELSRESLLSILRQMGDALDFAHSRGIVHRDIKPPNIMVTPLGRVKITDFGVAKVAHASSMTQGGAMLGTPDYMSPEQIAGTGVDGRADQFSLGVIAFELLSGERPFVAETLPALFYRIAHEPAPDVTLLNRTLSPEIGQVLERAMAKKAEDRFATCSAFVEALSEACAQSPGWHALPRGMSQTLPTVGDAGREARKTTEDSEGSSQATLVASRPDPVPAPTTAPPPADMPVAPAPTAATLTTPPQSAPRPAPPEEPVWVPTLPPPRVDPALAPPPAEPVYGGGGFITAAESQEPPQPEWLRDVHAEEEARSRSRKRGWVAALAAVVVAGAVLGAAYFGIGGLQIPGITPGPGNPPSADPSTTASTAGSAEPATTRPAETSATDADNNSASPEATAAKPPTPETGSTTPPAAAVEPPPASATKPPAAEPAKPKPPARTLATVRFMSEPPGAEVTIDADPKNRCETPCSLQLPLGRHTYSMRLTGYRNEIKLIDLKLGGETVSARLERRVGLVRVTSNPPGATVSVNGERQQGVTPLTLRLLPGTYRVSIEREGRRVERNVSVTEDSAVQIDATLQ
jgi:serine/threonine-protein kinase